MKRFTTILTIILVFLFVCSATALGQSKKVESDRRYNAIIFVQNAYEYQLLSKQAYRLATLQLKQGLANKKWSADEFQMKAKDFAKKTPAVILDVDETVLDNSPYNARNIIDEKGFNRFAWNNWCKEVKATAIPGVVEFIRQAEKLDVKIFYVTNRDDELKNATIENLKKIGLKANDDNVMTRNEEKGRGDDKLSRRAAVAKNHRIVLLIGDSMSDLCSEMGGKDQQQRNAVAEKISKMLGERWIMLPNAAYGSWERAVPQGANGLRTEREK